MNKKYFVLAALLSCSTIFGYTYRIEYLHGALPGRSPVNVLILFDVHEAVPASVTQQNALINAAQKLGIRNTQVLIEDSGHYTGTSKLVRQKIDNLREDDYQGEQFLRFLTEKCQTYGIDAINIDDYRYHRYKRSSARAMTQELLHAQKEIEGYTDGQELTKIYTEHLATDFRSRVAEDIRQTAGDYKTRETPLIELVSERHILQPLKRRGLLKKTVGDTQQEYTWRAPTLEAQKLIQQRAARPTDPAEQFAYNMQLLREAKSRIRNAEKFVGEAREIIDDAHEQLEDCTTFMGVKILEIKALHQIATLPQEKNTVIICIGGKHAKALSTLLTNKLKFKIRFTRGADYEDYRNHSPIDVKAFFDHYCESMLQQTISQFQAASPAMATPDMHAQLFAQFGSPVVHSSPVQRRLRAVRSLAVNPVLSAQTQTKRKATT